MLVVLERRIAIIGGELVNTSLRYLFQPVRVRKKNPAQCYEVKLVALEHLYKILQTAQHRRRHAFDKILHQISIHTDRSYSDHWLTRNLLDPTTKIFVVPLELWFPKTALRSMENIHPSAGQRVEPAVQRVRIGS